MLPIERTIIPDVIKVQQIISLPKRATVREAARRAAVHGPLKAELDLLTGLIIHRSDARVKLH